MADVADWLLTTQERGNHSTSIDHGRPPGVAWTNGNHVVARIHGADYFQTLADAVGSLGSGSHLWIADWRGDSDQDLAEGLTLGELLTAAKTTRAGKAFDKESLMPLLHNVELGRYPGPFFGLREVDRISGPDRAAIHDRRPPRRDEGGPAQGGNSSDRRHAIPGPSAERGRPSLRYRPPGP